MLKTVFPIQLLRLLLALIGIGSAYMAGSTLAALRRREIKSGRHYAWTVRALVCLGALAFRHNPDTLMIGGWVLAAVAFTGGLWHTSHRKPPEDLSRDIFPPEES